MNLWLLVGPWPSQPGTGSSASPIEAEKWGVVKGPQ